MTVLDQDLPSRIAAEMPAITVGRWIVTLIASLFYVVGYVAARTVKVVVYVSMWVYTAVRLGWAEGMAKPVAPARSQ